MVAGAAWHSGPALHRASRARPPLQAGHRQEGARGARRRLGTATPAQTPHLPDNNTLPTRHLHVSTN